MYRRKYYSRQYNRKKKINKKFSPSAYKNNPPSYYQQIGRIIQTSPLRMYEPLTQIPNSKTLEKMYNTLLKAKYPNVGPAPPPPPELPLQPYVVSFKILASDIYNLPDHRMFPINLAEFCSNSGSLTPLPPGWDYQFDLYTLEFREFIIPNDSDTSQYHLDLVHPVFPDNSPYQFVIKSLSTGSSGAINIVWLTSLIPLTENQAKITRGAFTTAGITITNPTLNTNDSLITDNGWYPFLSTAFDPDSQLNYIEYVANNSTISSLNVQCTVLCTPIESF